MARSNNAAGLAALSICESLLLTLSDLKILGMKDLRDLLTDVITTHLEAAAAAKNAKVHLAVVRDRARHPRGQGLGQTLARGQRRIIGRRSRWPCIQEETRAVTEWEYQKIDLSQQRPRNDDLDMLNAAGADGWELIGITSNSIAFMKRPIEELALPAEYSRGAISSANVGNTNGSDVREGRDQEVKAKYRDPETNETWSGRGRMANWLKRKQEAGEKIEKYLV